MILSKWQKLGLFFPSCPDMCFNEVYVCALGINFAYIYLCRRMRSLRSYSVIKSVVWQ